MRTLPLTLLLLACAGDDDTDTLPAETDADADADTDADSDADTDADSDADTDRTGDTGPVEPWVGEASTTDNGDGTFTTLVDATDQEGWTYLDLATRAVVSPTDPLTSADWDLAFRRDAIAVDGGVSGAGEVGVWRADHVPFEALTWPGSGPLLTDTDADGDDVVEQAFAGWYDYDQTSHRLSPADRTWIVSDRSGATWRLRFDGYYDGADVSGHPSFTWGPLTGPSPLTVHVDGDGSRAVTLAATDAGAPVHLRLGLDLALTPTDPATSDAWDLAVARTVISLGGGSSGGGSTEVAVLEGQDFAALSAAPATGFTTDADTDGDGATDVYAMGDWYDYDVRTHTLTPKDRVYVLRTTDGAAFKLQLLTYDDGTTTLRYAAVTP
ncbi:MAG: HmuY family protein [Alphaproteobacteria bacterium]|nr:HmuY family protein [Alphaproteobacteria bacterium]